MHQRLLPALSLLCVLAATLAPAGIAQDKKDAPPLRAKVSVKSAAEFEPFEKIILVADDFPYKSPQYSWDIEGTNTVDYEVINGKCYVWAAPGKYVVRLDAISWDDKKLAKTKFIFTVKGTVPPGPGPGPKPPDNGTALQKAVRAAYLLETDADKARQAAATAALFRTVAQTVESQKPGTAGQVWKALDAGVKLLGLTGKLPLVQKALQTELKKLPSKSTDVLDDTKRALIVSTFNDIASALESLEVKRAR